MSRKPKLPPIRSFPPIAAADARVLILGTMPSVTSLAKQQYYGHPQNAFWPIMGRLFAAGPLLPYEDRVRILSGKGVAIWDVLRECYREGSLDTAIDADSEAAHDFVTFLRAHEQIKSVFFNGHKAETAFRRHALAGVSKLGREWTFTRLPSTSSALAGPDFSQKLTDWRGGSRIADVNAAGLIE